MFTAQVCFLIDEALQLLDESVGGATPRGHQGPGGGYLRHSTCE